MSAESLLEIISPLLQQIMKLASEIESSLNILSPPSSSSLPPSTLLPLLHSLPQTFPPLTIHLTNLSTLITTPTIPPSLLLQISAYYLLPLTVCLRVSGTYNNMVASRASGVGGSSETSETYSGGNTARDVANRTIEASAHAISIYLARSITVTQTAKSYPPPSSLSVFSTECIVKTVVSLAMALPPGGKKESPSPSPSSPPSPPPSSSSQSSDAFEKLSASCAASGVLRAVEVIFTASKASASGPASRETTSQIVNMFSGALLAQLTQACITLASPMIDVVTDSSNDDAGQDNKIIQRGVNIQGNANDGQNDLKSSANANANSNLDASTRLQGLKTLSALIDLSPHSSTWAPLFPGTFSVLFSLSYEQLRTSPSGSAKLCQQGMECMGRLVEIVCGDLNFENEDEGAPAAADDAFAKLEKLKNSTKKAEPTPTPLSQLQSRVHPLLAALLLPSRSHPSQKIRLSALSLVSTLLLPCRNFSSPLSPLLLDTLLLLSSSSQNSENIRRGAEQTLSNFRDEIGSDRWKEIRSRFVVTRIESLLTTEVPRAVSGGRRLEESLTLLAGYLTLSESGSGLLILVGDDLMRATMRGFEKLFEMDLTSPIETCAVNADAIVTTGSHNVVVGGYKKRFSNLLSDGEAETSAFNMLGCLGRSLGSSQGIPIWVDHLFGKLVEREGRPTGGER